MNLAQAPTRLARMMIKIQGYDYAMKYSPEKAVPIADCLSSVPLRPGRHIKYLNIHIINDLNIHIINTPHFHTNTYTKHLGEDYKGFYSERILQHSNDWMAI